MKTFTVKRVDVHTYWPVWWDTNETTIDWKRCLDKNGDGISFSSLSEARAYAEEKNEEEKGESSK